MAGEKDFCLQQNAKINTAFKKIGKIVKNFVFFKRISCIMRYFFLTCRRISYTIFITGEEVFVEAILTVVQYGKQG